jgi:hypothetical protein
LAVSTVVLAEYREWSIKPFPVLEGDGAELDELYDRLVEFDSHAAGLISRVAHCSELTPGALEHDE